MQIVFGLPLAFYCLIRWLEDSSRAIWRACSGRWRCRRCRSGTTRSSPRSDCRRRGSTTWPCDGAAGGRAAVVAAVAVAGGRLALAPLAEPYFQVRREIGVERDLLETGRHSADVFTYFETTPWSRLYTADSPTAGTRRVGAVPGLYRAGPGRGEPGLVVDPRAERVSGLAHGGSRAWAGVVVAMVALAALSRQAEDARETPRGVRAHRRVVAWVAAARRTSARGLAALAGATTAAHARRPRPGAHSVRGGAGGVPAIARAVHPRRPAGSSARAHTRGSSRSSCRSTPSVSRRALACWSCSAVALLAGLGLQVAARRMAEPPATWSRLPLAAWR